ncbi:MAG: ion channel [Pseudomonadota bacterium]
MSQQILIQFAYAAALIGSTTLIHGLMIVVGRKIIRRPQGNDGIVPIIGDTICLGLISLWLFLSHIMASWMWAWLYLHVGISPNIEEAIYFSLVTYTTLGFGDLLAPVDWRLLTGAASANGLLLIGLSGAVLIDFTERLRGR